VDPGAGLLYEGYSFADQAISELSAYGSAVRPLMLTFLTVYGLLLIAFSVGMWRAGARRRALRWAAAFLLASTLVGLILHPFLPMSSRGMETGLNDTMHQVLTGVWGLFALPAVVFAAVAYRGTWRLDRGRYGPREFAIAERRPARDVNVGHGPPRRVPVSR
jgi:hypothetical protein